MVLTAVGTGSARSLVRTACSVCGHVASEFDFHGCCCWSWEVDRAISCSGFCGTVGSGPLDYVSCSAWRFATCAFESAADSINNTPRTEVVAPFAAIDDASDSVLLAFLVLTERFERLNLCGGPHPG